MPGQTSSEILNNKVDLSGEIRTITSNSDPELVIGQIKFGSEDDVSAMVERSFDAYATSDWTIRPVAERSIILIKSAQIMLAYRLELSTLIVQESGKVMAEALAMWMKIDFLHFYARQIMSFQNKIQVPIREGSCSHYAMEFPLAIPCGMVSSALVSGNTVILKPRSRLH